MSAIDTATTASFEIDVLQRSRREPVVVDFWAPWCGPCHQLSPLLERVAGRHAGKVAVVKVNVDEEPQLAARYRVQGIPAVKAFVDGEVAQEFTGVKPEPAIEDFFAALLPSEADRLVDEAAVSGDPEPLLRKALGVEPAHGRAIAALAERLSARGEYEEAAKLLERAPGDPQVAQVRSRLALASARTDADGLAELTAAAQAGDADARLRLGRALAAEGSHERAIDELLAAVADAEVRDDARKALLEVFDVLGGDHELVRRARPRLASALYA